MPGLLIKRFALIALTLMGLSLTPKASAAVWDTTQTWSMAWEQRYQSWVAQNWTRDFFLRPGTPYTGIKMDCADAVYVMRLVFAAENGLPFVMRDPSGGPNVISNQMRRWDAQSQPQRLRNFIEFVFSIGDTKSVVQDTYPTLVNRQYINSGSVLLTDRESHHAWTVRHVSRTGIPFLLFATRPARTELLERYEFPTMGFLFPKGIRPETNAGFRNFRWPEHLALSAWEVPGYSLEQYQFSPGTWSKEMQRRLALQKETLQERVARYLEQACRGARERVYFVNEGYRLNQRLGEACMTSTQYDEYSTPSKDRRLKGNFEDVQKVAAEVQRSRESVSPQVLDALRSVLSGDRGVSSQSYCRVTVAPGVVMSLGQVAVRSLNQMVSSNPHDSIEARWGLASGGEIARRCPVY